MKLADGWIANDANAKLIPVHSMVDVEYSDGPREFNLRVDAVNWSLVGAYRPHDVPAVTDSDDETPVTLNEARTALLRIGEHVANGVVPTPHHVGVVKDFLDQQISIEVLNNENALRAENNHFRTFIESAMRDRIASSARLEGNTRFESQIRIAIARGHLPVYFESQLKEWTA